MAAMTITVYVGSGDKRRECEVVTSGDGIVGDIVQDVITQLQLGVSVSTRAKAGRLIRTP